MGTAVLLVKHMKKHFYLLLMDPPSELDDPTVMLNVLTSESETESEGISWSNIDESESAHKTTTITTTESGKYTSLLL